MDWWIKLDFFFVSLLLLYIAWKDITTRIISHFSLLMLISLFIPLFIMQEKMPNIAAAFIVFILCFILFMFHTMGGGDVKLLTILSLAFFNSFLLTFLITTLLFGGVIAIVGLIAFRRSTLDHGVPYAVAMSLAFILIYPTTIAVQ
ncbi:Type IV leader peptidase family protein [Duffyella gerundensis]|jgi:prepilin peptidase CpaA|uniref:Putative membrane protein n=1 Tax=Duffyella gerundensis TaxID=1619313 RepID=A0A0U5L8S7_9GAMM|nr:prepilin peptidase [Duffyella gerundensis]QTO54487.1 prepilin peptidase [Duffyella gerundensis]UCB29690.1 Type IV leader peptidase family protein [Duffyella gerundensis]CUU25493.1 putative membrane protein [Duffyella gerundensis]